MSFASQVSSTTGQIGINSDFENREVMRSMDLFPRDSQTTMTVDKLFGDAALDQVVVADVLKEYLLYTEDWLWTVTTTMEENDARSIQTRRYVFDRREPGRTPELGASRLTGFTQESNIVDAVRYGLAAEASLDSLTYKEGQEAWAMQLQHIAYSANIAAKLDVCRTLLSCKPLNRFLRTHIKPNEVITIDKLIDTEIQSFGALHRDPYAFDNLVFKIKSHMLANQITTDHLIGPFGLSSMMKNSPGYNVNDNSVSGQDGINRQKTFNFQSSTPVMKIQDTDTYELLNYAPFNGRPGADPISQSTQIGQKFFMSNCHQPAINSADRRAYKAPVGDIFIVNYKHKVMQRMYLTEALERTQIFDPNNGGFSLALLNEIERLNNLIASNENSEELKLENINAFACVSNGTSGKAVIPAGQMCKLASTQHFADFYPNFFGHLKNKIDYEHGDGFLLTENEIASTMRMLIEPTSIGIDNIPATVLQQGESFLKQIATSGNAAKSPGGVYSYQWIKVLSGKSSNWLTEFFETGDAKNKIERLKSFVENMVNTIESYFPETILFSKEWSFEEKCDAIIFDFLSPYPKQTYYIEKPAPSALSNDEKAAVNQIPSVNTGGYVSTDKVGADGDLGGEILIVRKDYENLKYAWLVYRNVKVSDSTANPPNDRQIDTGAIPDNAILQVLFPNPPALDEKPEKFFDISTWAIIYNLSKKNPSQLDENTIKALTERQKAKIIASTIHEGDKTSFPQVLTPDEYGKLSGNQKTPAKTTGDTGLLRTDALDAVFTDMIDQWGGSALKTSVYDRVRSLRLYDAAINFKNDEERKKAEKAEKDNIMTELKKNAEKLSKMKIAENEADYFFEFNSEAIVGKFTTLHRQYSEKWKLMMAYALLLLPADRPSTWMRLINSGIPAPIMVLLFRPHVEFKMASAILMKKGRETLRLLLGRPNVSIGQDPTTKTIMAHATFTLTPVIMNPDKISVLPYVMFRSYEGGGCCSYFTDPDEDYQKEKQTRPSVFAIATRYDDKRTLPHQSITGSFENHPKYRYFDVNVKEESDAQRYSTASLYNRLYAWDVLNNGVPVSQDLSNYCDQSRQQWNTVVSQGLQIGYSINEGRFSHLVDSQGHLPNEAMIPESRLIFDGHGRIYPKFELQKLISQCN